jgi:hypothetical protein
LKTFKKGDKVLVTGGDISSGKYTCAGRRLSGKTCTILRVEDNWCKLEEEIAVDGGVYYEELTLIKRPEMDTESLLKIANEGRWALDKLHDIHGVGNIEWFECGKWQSGGPERRDIVFRVKPKKVLMEPWKTSNGWEVEQLMDRNNTVKIGCMNFSITALLNSLKSIMGDNPMINSYGIKLTATRSGVEHQGHYLFWPDAERLLKELERLQQ